MSKKRKEIKSSKEIAEEKAKQQEQKEELKEAAQQQGEKEVESQKVQVPKGEKLELTFSSYLIMLGALGWQFLGKVPNPVTGKIEKDLLQVKQIIELLEILEQKTKNNLSEDEENILRSTLVNLRLNYVDEVKKSEKEGGK